MNDSSTASHKGPTTRPAASRRTTKGAGPSRRLSYVLRHAPESIGVALDAAGWVDVDALLAGLAAAGTVLTRAELDEVVRSSDKQRFAFDASRTRIRANQGHSVHVDLGLPAADPPAQLFHGTVEQFLPSIWSEGLTRRSRQHVHLSSNVDTARQVASRRGAARLLVVDAQQMVADGYLFFMSANGVWLVETVPPRYLNELPG